MSATVRPRVVDLESSALAVKCPGCGLITPRFLQYCRSCSFSIWPSGPVASEAFAAWRKADPRRARVSRYELQLRQKDNDLVDYNHRAGVLGIHLFPPSASPILLSLGLMLLALAAVPFPLALLRIGLAAFGGFIFLLGVVGWLVVEDSAMFPDGQE
ncbi:MAG: hypothetical protein ACREN8_04630 [Candidatus Dormibacteraceae bacterium]